MALKHRNQLSILEFVISQSSDVLQHLPEVMNVNTCAFALKPYDYLKQQELNLIQTPRRYICVEKIEF